MPGQLACINYILLETKQLIKHLLQQVILEQVINRKG
jgi:hypothetical protein